MKDLLFAHYSATAAEHKIMAIAPTGTGIVDGTKAGELEWAWRPGGTVEVHLDVDPAHRRKGIGRAMLDELIRHLAEQAAAGQGRDMMSLYSFSASNNDQACAFFRGCGFTAHFVQHFYGKGRHGYFYSRPIGEPK